MKSLRAQGSRLSDSVEQLNVLNSVAKLPRFSDKLLNGGIFPLKSKSLEILQVNVGYQCNQTCDHCHVDAGPDRKEVMSWETMQQCLAAVDNSSIKVVDITGGAPEMNPNFIRFVQELSRRNVNIIVRSNLTILVSNKKYEQYPEFFKKHNLTVIASLPCYTETNTDQQRGNGVFNSSIRALKRLNDVGYGKSLELHLVYNPGGAFIAPDQKLLELDYKTQLKNNYDIEFNNLYAITNLPISRFLDYLMVIGKHEEYLHVLVNAFNPEAAEKVMCRNTLSVDWKGQLYDCDFNQMLRLAVGAKIPKHIGDFDQTKIENRTIITNQHCFGCTAGAGSSCQGAIT